MIHLTQPALRALILLGVSVSFLGASAQLTPTNSWFDEVLRTCSTTDTATWRKTGRAATWANLRSRYKDHDVLMEMSWEERDRIWQQGIAPTGYKELAGRYRQGYLTSCRERGIVPSAFDTSVNDVGAIGKLRDVYLASRKAEYIIHTPKASKAPAVNGAMVYGVRAGHEVIYRVPATGEAPLTITVSGLPSGLIFNKTTNVIRGRVGKTGVYPVRMTVSNKHGRVTKNWTLKVGDEIALTPPLGWNSWNSFACDVTAQDIRNTADQLVKTGLAGYGWNYINIDDCWMKKPDVMAMPSGKDRDNREAYFKAGANQRKRFNEPEVVGDTRDAQGNVLSNKDFADMKALTDYVHNMGFKAGLYTSPGPLTCQRFEGSYQYELADAKQFAAWGFDYLKYDWCGLRGVVPTRTLESAKAPYETMGIALRSVDRDVFYSLCQYGWNEVWKWGSSIGGNAWRTTGDIRDNWESMTRIGFGQAGLEPYAAPGRWNDPDMLVVGYVGWSKNLRPTYLSPNEQYTHISLWSLLAAPLLIGCDLTRMDDFTYGLLSNSEVLAINQDPLGKQAARIIKDSTVQVWAKPMQDGSLAVGIFNLGEEPVSYAVPLATLGLSGNYVMRDVWKQLDVGSVASAIDAKVNRHGVMLMTLRKR